MYTLKPEFVFFRNYHSNEISTNFKKLNFTVSFLNS